MPHASEHPEAPGASVTRRITRYVGDAGEPADDLVAVEEPLELRLNDEPMAITMRTPGHDVELAAGFCVTEGVVEDAADLEDIQPCHEAAYGNVVLITLTDEALDRRRDQISRARRELYLSSSCGLCGTQSIDRLWRRIPPLRQRFTVSPDIIQTLPTRMREAQATFDRTGGLHAAAWFAPDGRLRRLREDVGRHNAVDKVIGAEALETGTPLNAGVLLVSGRASFEIIQKAAVAGIGCVCAVSAPSSLAVDAAKQLDVTLIGFLRDARMNVYHDSGRLT